MNLLLTLLRQDDLYDRISENDAVCDCLFASHLHDGIGFPDCGGCFVLLHKSVDNQLHMFCTKILQLPFADIRNDVPDNTKSVYSLPDTISNKYRLENAHFIFCETHHGINCKVRFMVHSLYYTMVTRLREANLRNLENKQQKVEETTMNGCFDVSIILAIARRHAEELAHVLQLAAIRQVVVCQDGNQRQNLELIILTAEPVVFELCLFVINPLILHFQSPSGICG